MTNTNSDRTEDADTTQCAHISLLRISQRLVVVERPLYTLQCIKHTAEDPQTVMDEKTGDIGKGRPIFTLNGKR